MSFGPFGYTRYTQKFASAVFRAGGTISWRQLYLVDNLAYWLWLWNGDTSKWGVELEKTFEFVYPFVGGSAVAHSFNLVDPTKGRITWVGGVTHNANGITGDGTGLGKTGIKFAGNFSGGGAGVTAKDTWVIFGCHIYSGSSSDVSDMGNAMQNLPSPPYPPGTTTTSYALLQTRTVAGYAQFINGTLSGGIGGAVPTAVGFRVALRYADNGFVGYRSNGNIMVRVASNELTNAQGNEGQWCLLSTGDDDPNYSLHTMMGAFLTKSAAGSSPMPGPSPIFSDAKVNELWNYFNTFNQQLGRTAT